jgi:hypothetical protein
MALGVGRQGYRLNQRFGKRLNKAGRVVGLLNCYSAFGSCEGRINVYLFSLFVIASACLCLVKGITRVRVKVAGKAEG